MNGTISRDAITTESLASEILNAKVRRDINKSKKPTAPLVDLTGKGIIEGSNNFAKMNYQNN